VGVQDDVLNPLPQRRVEPLTQSPAHVEEQPLTLANRETRISEPTSVPTLTKPAFVQPPLAPPVIQREVLESEITTTRLVLKDSKRIKPDRHSATSEAQQETESSQTSTAVTEIGATPP